MCFFAPISTLSNSVQNQKIHLQPVPCVEVTYTANYPGCSAHKSLQRSNLKSNPNSKNYVNYNTYVNKQGIQSSERTLSTPFNITNNKTFPNLTQKPQNHSNSNKTESRSNPPYNI
uniref:Uncharacterized protein n=1 Tax=Sipha flava TaxID=143950 RepID=A0A2S2PVH8_9HEMI